ncbi:DUF1501 domain-containing protein [Blastopirellula sp. JC732]|uniref:DUF1501 domain-containing protein n=1 Tax=Blastopirellula sediminis TaxID=2894196 RepID=A0A9X1SF31_9BACT|nr:DUF1501 domain-containing protein [Blastopirellula sediminis]MCC9608046.1 DUF1501 domain-containing protein [Blastopirellula sediminis]MCC9627161.1 DUF1501 domain-containing protein [Blastopirellula sediminis]
MPFSQVRRDFLYGLGASLGAVAFNSLLADEASQRDPLAARQGHHPAKAKSCIFIFLEGGPSHIDTFDPKPELEKLHMKEFVRKDQFASGMASGKRYYIKSPFTFSPRGKSGLVMSDQFRHLGQVADELCIYHGCQGESIDHPTACYHMNTGNRFGGDPAMGAWTTYGLGTENQNLPAFVVLPEVAYPQGGAANWSNGFLSPTYQGTPLRASGDPILDLRPQPGVTEWRQRKNLDLLASLNAADQVRYPQHQELAARMDAYELAFRMQAEVPGIVDLKSETEATLEAYGLNNPETESVGRRCLLARRLVESGVRFVQIWIGGWDSHDYLERSHSARIRAFDQPVAALVADLRSRGLLDETLVVCTGEFGRSPDNGVRGGENKVGRDHNAKAMSMWMAGGGVKRGERIGATDEIGGSAVEVVHPIRDVHCTLLHLLGLNDNKLTFFHEGRYKQLSQIGGSVIKEIIA